MGITDCGIVPRTPDPASGLPKEATTSSRIRAESPGIPPENLGDGRTALQERVRGTRLARKKPPSRVACLCSDCRSAYAAPWMRRRAIMPTSNNPRPNMA